MNRRYRIYSEGSKFYIEMDLGIGTGFKTLTMPHKPVKRHHKVMISTRYFDTIEEAKEWIAKDVKQHAFVYEYPETKEVMYENPSKN